MSRFIETIRVENRRIQLLERHQERVTRTLTAHGVTTIPDLSDRLEQCTIQFAGRVRLRIEYDINGLFEVFQFEYMRKKMNKLHLAHIIPPDYRYKYADRAWINALVEKSGADEILMIRDGKVTDTSIANIAFYDGSTWWTPDTPLLSGTERSRLLHQGIIQEGEISPEDLGGFKEFRVINAMLPWEDNVSYDMSIIS
jgi:4-amino-4-deoxychorismate lyase